MRIFIFIFISTFSIGAVAQTGIGKQTTNASAIVDVSNATNKAFLPPRVSLTNNLYDNVNPVNNPVEGLIVYNVGNLQLEGFYIWNKGVWSLMATKENSVSNAVVAYAQGAKLNFLTDGAYLPVTGGQLVFNSIPGVAYMPSTGIITFPAGNYNVQVTLNVIGSTETTSGGIGSTAVTNIHFYTGKFGLALLNAGAVVEENAISNTSSTVNPKRHSANFIFSFKTLTSISVPFNIAHVAGSGTYAGQLEIINGFVHIQKNSL